MWQRLMTVRSPDPIRRTQGMLLIGTAFSLMLVALLYVPVALFIPPVWLVPAMLVFAGICAGVIVLAQRGQTAAGGTILTIIMVLLIPTATASENLLQGPVGLVFLLPMLVIGMTVSAAGILVVGGVSLALLVIVQVTTATPWNERTVQLMLMLVVFGIILWLIFQSMNRALRQAVQRTLEAETTRTLLEAREGDLLQTHGTLVSQNADLQRLVALVQELEVPMIPVQQGMLVVPLVGHMDAQRAERLTTRVLTTIRSHGATVIILDVTGLLVVDTHVLRYVQRLAQGIRLLGAQTIITGMSPVLATTIVRLGIDLSWVRTVSSVHEVLTHPTSANQ